MSSNDNAIIISRTNRQRRTPCCLLLDASESVAGMPLDLINRELPRLAKTLEADNIARMAVELCLIRFGGDAQILQPFREVASCQMPTLTASGGTPMGAAVNLALDQNSEFHDRCRAEGISCAPGWIWMFTDGAPTDPDVYDEAARARR